MSPKHILTLVIALPVLASCATVSRSSQDHFRIDTVPQGARVITTLETQQSQEARKQNYALAPRYIECPSTPCAIPLPRRSEFIATVQHEGYAPAEIAIGYSTQRASGLADMGQLGGAAATGAATGAAAGTMAVVTTQVSSGILSAVSTTLGGPVFSANTAGTVANATAAGLTTGLVVGVAGIAIDSASGANLNLYPNPLVIKLAPEGAPVLIDPNVQILRQSIMAEQARREARIKRAAERNNDPDRKSAFAPIR